MAMENDDTLIELASIVSNGNEQVIRDVTMLVRVPEVFVEAHKEWYESTFADSVDDDNADIIDVFTSWLVEAHVGAIVGWNAKPQTIVGQLSELEDTLSYPLHIDDIEFTGNEKTGEFLDLLGNYLEDKKFGLYRLDIDADSFLLLVVRDEDEDDFSRDVANLGLEGHMH